MTETQDLATEIDLTRHEIRDTVAELNRRLNVKRRVETAARRNVQTAQTFLRDHRTALTASGATVLATVVVFVFVRR